MVELLGSVYYRVQRAGCSECVVLTGKPEQLHLR